MQLHRAFVLSVTLLAALAGHGPSAQDTPKLRRDPELKEAVDTLAKALKDRKLSRDAEASALIERLGTSYGEDLHAKDTTMIEKAIAKVFVSGPVRPPQATLYRAAADALGKMGEKGAQALQKAHDSRRFPNKPEWSEMRAHLLQNIGKTKTPRAARFLAERVARASHDEELAAAGAALVNFAEADQKLRKELVKELVRKLGGLESTAALPVINQPGQPQFNGAATAQRTLNKVKRPWLRSLTALAKTKHPNGTEWQRWYNKNKARNWDK